MRFLHQLRWKLTLSYTLVTVCAFLVITLILGGFLFSKVLFPVNMMTPEGVVQSLLESLNPMWSHILSQSPVDKELVFYLLEDPGANISTVSLFQVGTVKITINTIAALRVFVVDSAGILLGASDPGFPPTSPIGATFPVERLSGLQTIYAAAQGGETNPKMLFSSQGTVNSMWGLADRFTMVIPVFDRENDTPGTVLGVIIVVFDSFPYQSTIPGHLLVLAGRSLLFFLLSAGIMGAIFGSISASSLTGRFKRLSSATEIWSEGDFSAKIEDRSGDELAKLAERLNAMAGQLQSLLRKRQEMAISEERNRLARDLHDSAKQQALAASFELGTALALCERDPKTAKQHLVDANTLVDKVKEELANLVHELRPFSGEEQDLTGTLRDYAREWSLRNKIDLRMDIIDDVTLSMEAREALFRIAQEALANVNRHSAASHVEVSLAQEVGLVRLTIQDNGRGFNPEAVHTGLGLTSMKERAEGLGGSLTVKSTPGQGTQVTLTLPN